MLPQTESLYYKTPTCYLRLNHFITKHLHVTSDRVTLLQNTYMLPQTESLYYKTPTCYLRLSHFITKYNTYMLPQTESLYNKTLTCYLRVNHFITKHLHISLKVSYFVTRLF